MTRMHVRQRGVAVVTALLLTTLAVTIVGSLFWQQQVQVRSIENQRLQLQKQWILRGALDWTRLILGEDKRIDVQRNRLVDELGEPWATPLAETRLDQYVEKENAGDVPDAALSGGISDAQARYNLADLCKPDGTIDADEVRRFGKLLSLLQVNAGLAQPTAQLIQSGMQKPGSATRGGAASSGAVPMGMLHADDLLAVPGFTPELLEKVRDYVIVLPRPGSGVTKVNLNTAAAEVIAAKVDTLSLGDANALVARRQRGPFMRVEDAGLTDPNAAQRFGVSTDYFLVNGNVRLNRAGMDMQALMQRGQAQAGRAPPVTVLWIRQH